MNILNTLSVRAKLGFAFLVVLVLMVLQGALSSLELARVYEQTETLMTYRLPGVRDSGRMAEAATRMRSREYRALVSTPEELPNASNRIEKAKVEFAEASKAYAAAISDDKERVLFENALKDWKTYEAHAGQVVGMMQAGKAEEARLWVSGPQALARFDRALASIKELTAYNDKLAQDDVVNAKSIFHGALWGTAIALAITAVIALMLGWYLGRIITVPLERAVKLAQAVSQGDLTQEIHAQGKDEVAQLSRALGEMVTQLRSVVVNVRRGVDAVTTASTQIAVGNQDLSQRTEEQASNLQETAASMEQLTSTVRQNADNARAAAELSTGASQVAARGGQVVGDVVSTMAEISQSSSRIADIIGVIDGIAFQTNILALNAAVEAARAGEQGRGFAVVAGEVRSLAQRSAQAAKEIKTLIEHSASQVQAGTRLVADAGDTMRDVVEQVQRVNDLVSEIMSASQEQSQGIQQVSDAVSQLDQVTQQNAALVEQSAAAADSMRAQARTLSQTVAVFNTRAAA